MAVHWDEQRAGLSGTHWAATRDDHWVSHSAEKTDLLMADPSGARKAVLRAYAKAVHWASMSVDRRGDYWVACWAGCWALLSAGTTGKCSADLWACLTAVQKA